MTEHQRLFLVQARTNYRVFRQFQENPGWPACHSLHYLQMATELFGKSHAWKNGRPAHTHRAFVAFLRGLADNRKAQKQLGFGDLKGQWRQVIRKSIEFAQYVEDLAPALAGDGPNPEYPWPPDNPAVAPVEFSFDLSRELQEKPAGRKFLYLIQKLFEAAEAFL